MSIILRLEGKNSKETTINVVEMMHLVNYDTLQDYDEYD